LALFEQLTLSGKYYDRNEFWHVATGGLERDAHHGIWDPDGVADDGRHPRRQVGGYRDPYNAHDERYQIPVFPSFISAVRYGNEQY